MNEKVLKTLEYNKIITQLSENSSSILGKELCRKLLPTSDIEEITRLQQETADALSRLLKKGSLSFRGAKDIGPSLKRLDVGATLGITELLNISSLLDCTLRVKAYGRTEEESEGVDSLTDLFNGLEPLTPFNNELKRCIVSEEEISDEASSTLKSIRRSIKITGGQIHDQLNQIVNSNSGRTMLMDNIITMRNGRYCLPVKAEYRSKFPGMIHDQSSSGSTLFIEPMSVVKLNNSIREYEIKEQEEIERILADLSNQAAEHIPALTFNLDALAKLDFIFARANLAKQMKASQPIFNQNGYIHIKKGRHPLIDPKKVVPIDIYLGKEFHLLIITGPNTGGKTVSLKTVGLFTLMGQAGLHIPAFDGSSLAVFEEVYADIGDEQSIEQSLSTFSSHMTNTVSILNKANENSLVLFDELGAGTDPTEGAALAISILSYLHQRNIRTMATTHYSELKVYALTTEGVENACCEFSVETLQPTYRLLIGIPGKSNAFAISSKLGLSDAIIEDAKERITTEDQKFEDLLTDLEDKRVTIEKEQEEIRRYREETEALREKLKEKSAKMESSKERILREANEEARRILQEAKDYADNAIKQYNKWGLESGLNKEMENQRNALRDRLKETDSSLIKKNKIKDRKNNKPEDFKLGDSVFVTSLNLKGTISSLPNAKGDCFVQMGILRSQVNISDLELIDEPEITGPNLQKTGSGKIKMNKTFQISPELNIIGKKVDEALPVVEKYLDDAYLAHLPQVTIIHGRGTGALKNAVHGLLKRTKYVKTFRVGGFGEGDHGVTIVQFKE